ncbi:hypothetical protein CVT25_001159 [Psilocybe cyanescens]|uniref:Uncharacterized protein n=1 Tax=Psilocybe cyanescens TaxID=93625 RepID=A0A409XEM7_PSICY|nr:hypothetical protein CVT25_001159 [Psilocybe cyanescens]
MTSTIKLGDDFMKIPRLDEAGKNWVIYKARFLWSIDAHGKLKHVDGSVVAPADPVIRTVNQVLTSKEETLDAEWRKEMRIWNQGEAIETAYAIWEALVGEFKNKSRMVSVNLHHRLQQERCAKCRDVRAHFSKLRLMCKDLAAMGQAPSEDNFYAIIMGSHMTPTSPL